ncbi:TetR/AcrR family transcriptional regulator [Leeia sp. TBRC 13508]|uniref:TetR/AcrR family transcriptional regulator n=1 Tax=Leeia speluncae TaxID=2884804 RepID=A0ABS8D8P5_9NEIS|nr:TetR family transcriptional regulator [Leeia speluncae]MCB6184604.1 TetR/AcrR family transcriptional regulator [Leeia speluncae]
MNSKVQKRARDESSKIVKRQTILQAALELFLGGYQLPKVDDIAEKAGLAKGTVYLYFASREEIYFHLVTIHSTAYWDSLEVFLAECGDLTPEKLARWILNYHDSNPHYLPMASILNKMLEEASELNQTLEFKQLLAAKLITCGGWLDKKITGITPGEGSHLLLALNALTVGLWERANPTKAVRDLLDLLELGNLRVNFQKEAEKSVMALCKGYSSNTTNTPLQSD